MKQIACYFCGTMIKYGWVQEARGRAYCNACGRYTDTKKLVGQRPLPSAEEVKEEKLEKLKEEE